MSLPKTQGERQKQRILASARDLFWTKGYESTSLKDIAGACGFEAANIYNYFSSKELVLYEALKEEMNRLLSPIRGLADDDSGDPVEQLRLLIHNHFDVTLSHGKPVKLLFDFEQRHLSRALQEDIIRLRDSYDNILRKVVHRGVDGGVFADVDVSVVGFAIASIIARSGIWYSRKGRLSKDEIEDIMFQFILNGLRPGTPTQRQEKSHDLPQGLSVSPFKNAQTEGRKEQSCQRRCSSSCCHVRIGEIWDAIWQIPLKPEGILQSES